MGAFCEEAETMLSNQTVDSQNEALKDAIDPEHETHSGNGGRNLSEELSKDDFISDAALPEERTMDEYKFSENCRKRAEVADGSTCKDELYLNVLMLTLMKFNYWQEFGCGPGKVGGQVGLSATKAERKAQDIMNRVCTFCSWKSGSNFTHSICS